MLCWFDPSFIAIKGAFTTGLTWLDSQQKTQGREPTLALSHV